MPDMTPVIDSEAINAVGHDGKDMHVAWKSGTTSIHPNVPVDKFRSFLAAPSKGKFFHSQIRAQHPGVTK